MKKNFLSFLTVKVQLVLLFALAGSVWLTILQNQRLYREQVKSANKSAFVNDSEETANHLDDRLEGYAVAIKGIAKVAIGIPGTAQVAQLDAWMAQKSGYAAFQLFKKTADGKILSIAEVFTKSADNKKLGGKTVDKVFPRFAKMVLPWLDEELKKNPKQERLVKSFTTKADIPVFAVAGPYADGSDGVIYWGVLTIWNDEIKDLLKSRENSSYQQIVLDGGAQVFLAMDAVSVKRQARYDALPVVAAAKGAEGGSVFLPSYRDEAGREWMGAVHSSDRFHFLVVTQLAEQEAYRAWDKALIETVAMAGCYGAIFLLIGFLVTADYSKKIRAITQVIRQIAGGNLNLGVKVRGGDHVAQLGMTINYMTDQLKKIVVHNLLKTKNEKFREILGVTGGWGGLPAADGPIEGLKMSAKLQQSGTSCTDFVYRSSGSYGIVYLFIGSGSHAGIRGAMESSMLYSALVTLMRERARISDDPKPGEILSEIDRTLFGISGGSMNANLFIGMVDTCNGILLYAGAGNNVPVLMVLNDKDDPRLFGQKASLTERFATLPLDSKYAALGVDGKTVFEDKSLSLFTGEKVIYCAKSVADASHSGITKLSTAAVSSSLIQKGEAGADTLIKMVMELYRRDGESQNDTDIAIMVAEFVEKVAPQKAAPQEVVSAETPVSDPFVYDAGPSEVPAKPLADPLPRQSAPEVPKNPIVAKGWSEEMSDASMPMVPNINFMPDHGPQKVAKKDPPPPPPVAAKTPSEPKQPIDPFDFVGTPEQAQGKETKEDKQHPAGNLAGNKGPEGADKVEAPPPPADMHTISLSKGPALVEAKREATPPIDIPDENEEAAKPKQIALSMLSSDEQKEIGLERRSLQKPSIQPPPAEHGRVLPPFPIAARPLDGVALEGNKTGMPASLPPPTPEEWDDAYKAMGLAPPLAAKAATTADHGESGAENWGFPASAEDGSPSFSLDKDAETSPAQEEPEEYHLSMDQAGEDLSGSGLVFDLKPEAMEEKNPPKPQAPASSLAQMLSRDFFPAMSQTSVLPPMDLDSEEDKGELHHFSPLQAQGLKEAAKAGDGKPLANPISVSPPEGQKSEGKLYATGSYFDDDGLFVLGKKISG